MKSKKVWTISDNLNKTVPSSIDNAQTDTKNKGNFNIFACTI